MLVNKDWFFKPHLTRHHGLFDQNSNGPDRTFKLFFFFESLQDWLPSSAFLSVFLSSKISESSIIRNKQPLPFAAQSTKFLLQSSKTHKVMCIIAILNDASTISFALHFFTAVKELYDQKQVVCGGRIVYFILHFRQQSIMERSQGRNSSKAGTERQKLM